MGLCDYTVYDVMCRNAQLYPDRDAIVFRENRMTHGQFKERSDQLAAGLIR